MLGSFAASRPLIIAGALLLLSCGGTAPGSATGGDPASVNNRAVGAGGPVHAGSAPDLKDVKTITNFRNTLGQACRVVEKTIVINGQQTAATGTVCQQYDGHWEMVLGEVQP